jgi:hypothetical protein
MEKLGRTDPWKKTHTSDIIVSNSTSIPQPPSPAGAPVPSPVATTRSPRRRLRPLPPASGHAPCPSQRPHPVPPACFSAPFVPLQQRSRPSPAMASSAAALKNRGSSAAILQELALPWPFSVSPVRQATVTAHCPTRALAGVGVPPALGAYCSRTWSTNSHSLSLVLATAVAPLSNAVLPFSAAISVRLTLNR